MNNRFAPFRALAREEKPDENINDLLVRHNCHYWLTKHYGYTLSAQAVLNKLCVQTRFAVCSAVFRSLETHGVPYAVMKGAVLSQTAYGDPFARQSGDIDLLVDRRDVDRVKRILNECGFQQGFVTKDGVQPFTRKQILFQTAMSHQIAPFIASTQNPLCPYVNVDINLDILWGESLLKTDMSKVLSHTIRASLFGTEFLKLEPHIEFIALCLHHYKDMNSPYLLSNGSLRISLFCDIWYYLKNVRPDIADTKRISDALGVTDYVYYCLYYAYVIFENAELAAWCEVFHTVNGQQLLPSFGLSKNARYLWNMDFEERLFCDDLSVHLQTILPESELDAIAANRENM